MMNKYIKCIFLSVLLLILVFVTHIVFINTNDKNSIVFFIDANSGTEKIQCWEKDDQYIVFLPSYADLSKVFFQINTDCTIRINNMVVMTGMNCSNYELGKEYSFACDHWSWKPDTTITFLQSDNIATMYIDTQSASMEYIHAQKGNEEQGIVRLFTNEGVIDYSGELASINGRGNNTWESFEKKPYSIKLSEKANLLGMGCAQKWILLANADDPSHMRNKIVYDFAKEIGLEYSPDSRWIDLYLNGEYAGLYLLSERNELHEERIDISPDGSFIVSLERADRLIAQNYAYVETNEKQALRIHYPTSEIKDFNWIADTWQSVENAILAENEIDEKTGKQLWDLIDINSWAKKYLVEEIFASGDACFISQFFYLDGAEENTKVYAGPVWDFDHCLGTRAAWALTEPKSMYANRLHVKDGFDRPWFHKLYNNNTFYDHLVTLYAKEFLPLLESFIDNHIPNYSAIIKQAATLNSIRWNVNSEGYLAEQSEICDFLSARIVFLNSIWLDNTEYHLVKIDESFGGFYGYYALYTGELLESLPDLEDTEQQTFSGWYYADTNQPLDITKPITEDIEIYAKWENKVTKKLNQVLKLAPLGVIAVIGLGLLIADVRESRRA